MSGQKMQGRRRTCLNRSASTATRRCGKTLTDVLHAFPYAELHVKPAADDISYRLAREAEERLSRAHDDLRALVRLAASEDDKADLHRTIDDLTDAEAALKAAQRDGSFVLVHGLLSLAASRLSRLRQRLTGTARQGHL